MREEWVKAFPVPFPQDYQREHPNAVGYCMRHGAYRMMAEAWLPDLKGYKNTEEVYGICLDRGCTWEELLSHKEDESIIR